MIRHPVKASGTLTGPLVLHRVLHNFQPTRNADPRQNQPRRHWITPELPKRDERLTDENQQFLQEIVQETYISPLRNPPPERAPWTW